MKTVKELQGMLDQKRDELAKIFAEAKTVVDGEDRYELDAKQLEDVRARNEEIDDLAKQLEDAKMVDEAYLKNAQAIKEANKAASNLPLANGEEPGGETPPLQAQKSLGEQFVESEDYQGRQGTKDIVADFPEYEFKTLFETGAGFAPESVRTGRVVPYAHRRPMIADLMPNTPTSQAAIKYMEETTFTNAADTVAEGGSYPESALAFTERTESIYKISTFLPVTDEQVEDVPVIRSVIDNRLLTMLALAEETKLVSGSGSSDITGFLVKSGVQSQAKGADPVPDAIYKGMTLVRHTGFAEPSAVVFHPNDWQTIRLLRTTDGIYIWGNPSEAGPERIWGLPAVITTAETENTALLGDFPLYCELFRRKGANIKVSDSHSDYFVKGKLAIRADERVTLAIYRAAAFCEVTGI